MSDAHLTAEERDALAAELALGVLSGEERAQALRLQLADADFADRVARWRERLSPLHAEWDDVPAPEAAWSGIEQRLGEGNGQKTTAIRALRIWRATAAISSAAAALMAIMLVTRPEPLPPTPREAQSAAIAQLAGEEGGPIFTARYEAATSRLHFQATGPLPGPLAPELWVIPADGVPRSLGIVKARGRSVVEIASGHRSMMIDGSTLAVTMEPLTGAPHAAPSSAPIAAGKIVLL